MFPLTRHPHKPATRRRWAAKKLRILLPKRAYNQVTLNEMSPEVTTINTHRGLYRYKSLPFGVSIKTQHMSWYGKSPKPLGKELRHLAHPLASILKEISALFIGYKKQQPFNAVKAAQSSTDALIHYDPIKALIMCRDASSYGVKPALLHQIPSSEEKLSYSPRAKCLSPRTIINSFTRKLLESRLGLNGSIWPISLPFEIRMPRLGPLGESKSIQPFSPQNAVWGD